MKQVSVIFSIVLLCTIIDCIPLQNPDFIFPDDNEPNGIPKWALHSQRRIPPQRLPSNGGGFQPQNGFPFPGGFLSQSGFPNNFGSSPQKFPPITVPTLTTVSIADVNTITTTPSPAFHICMQNCPVTSEYNPICGSNQALYYNLSKLRCAQRCGADAQVLRKGNCRGLFPGR